MKLTVSKEAIIEGLQKVQSIVSTRTTLPILSNVLLKAEQDKLSMSTSDLEVNVRTSVDAKVAKAGGTTLPARRIFSIFKELPGSEIDIDVTDKDVASIRCGASYYKILGISEDEFPPLPPFEGGKTYSLDQGIFRSMLKNTSYAASTDETRYVLNGVLLSFSDDKLTVVATDGRRLALVEQEIEFPKGSEADLVIPTKTVDELIKTLGEKGSLKVEATQNQVAFEFDDMLIVSKLIEGTYPNFHQVIPSGSEERVVLEREGLLTAVRRAALLSIDKSSSVKLIFSRNKLEIVATTPDIGEARESLPLKYSGKDITISFNPDFVMDPLRYIEDDEVFLELTDDTSPGILKCSVPFLYVLMPMRTA